MRIKRFVVVGLFASALSVMAHGSALAQQVNPQDFGIVEAPVAGSVSVPMAQVPAALRHSAQVAAKQYDGQATLTSVQLDKDDILGVYEFAGTTSDGRSIEVDIRPDGTVEELEIQIGRGQVPAEVFAALERFAPGFVPAGGQPRIEKSIRPSANGLSEIWYEFSGTTFDVEVRSDGRALLIEPA